MKALNEKELNQVSGGRVDSKFSSFFSCLPMNFKSTTSGDSSSVVVFTTRK